MSWRWIYKSRLGKLILGFISIAITLFLTYKAGLSLESIGEATLFSSTVLALTAMGEAIDEKAGLVNIGLEGILLITAGFGVYFAEIFNNGYMGLLMGLVVGALIGFLFSLISIYGKADQIVAGMGINIFAYGFISYFMMAEWAFPGLHIPPQSVLVKPWYIGGMRISSITVLTIILAFLLHFMLYRTPLGLRIRAAGEKPDALDVAGVRVDYVRIFGATFGGALAGLAGAFMPLAWFGGLTKEISAGRGFIALAVLVAAGLEPLLSLAFALLFGFSEGLSYAIAITPGIKEKVPYHLVLLIPYITTLIVVTIFIGKKRFPKALGLPYTRE